VDVETRCVEHLWRLQSVTFGVGGSWSEYECERCSALLAVGPKDPHPETA
jgi:hypothetical protein